ncbi:hypothetical protein BLNAU_13045 [Blattamonas nauphoetae]|uniref:DUF4817 domain-containing protein n=1 Tax=Blattamonas nauphoetae TaxID=2049346 RepID=A0ABQ9XL69_9EUKA|nr:hypothetical protein BLNAU_13045 [Blattamonas nauphoetae]
MTKILSKPADQVTIYEGLEIVRIPRRLIKAERVHAIALWYQFRDVNLVLDNWGLPHTPYRRTIQNLVRRFEDTGSTVDLPRSGRPRAAHAPEARERVERKIENAPTQSIRQRIPDLQLTYGSAHRIIPSLGYRPYRLQSSQCLFDQDYLPRRQFCEWFLAMEQNDPLFIDHIWYSDESRFTLDKTVNLHNRYYFSRDNPHYHVEIPNTRRGINVWCAVSSLGSIGPLDKTSITLVEPDSCRTEPLRKRLSEQSTFSIGGFWDDG